MLCTRKRIFLFLADPVICCCGVIELDLEIAFARALGKAFPDLFNEAAFLNLAVLLPLKREIHLQLSFSLPFSLSLTCSSQNEFLSILLTLSSGLLQLQTSFPWAQKPARQQVKSLLWLFALRKDIPFD